MSIYKVSTRALLTAIMLLILLMWSSGYAMAFEPLYELKWAPSASDIHVENYSHIINEAAYKEDCLIMITTYIEDGHYWCEPTPVHDLIKPLDLSQY